MQPRELGFNLERSLQSVSFEELLSDFQKLRMDVDRLGANLGQGSEVTACLAVDLHRVKRAETFAQELDQGFEIVTDRHDDGGLETLPDRLTASDLEVCVGDVDDKVTKLTAFLSY